MLSTTVPESPVVIAVDPHKASWTAAAVSSALAPLATITVQVGPQGYRQPRRFAERWSTVPWAIEGASGPGGPLVTRLVSDGSKRWTYQPSSPPGFGCCPPGTAERTTTPTRSPSG
jgi:hypothetical protein